MAHGPMVVNPVVAQHAAPPARGSGLGIWLALFGALAASAGLLLIVVAVTVGLFAGGYMGPTEPDRVVQDDPRPPPVEEWEDEDFGELRIRDGSRRNTGGGGTRTAPVVVPDPEPEKPPEPTGPAPDSITLTIPGTVRITQVELSCPSGKRVRQAPSAGRVVFTGVPSETCRVSFKGGTITTQLSVDPGVSLNCQPLGSSALACR